MKRKKPMKLHIGLLVVGLLMGGVASAQAEVDVPLPVGESVRLGKDIRGTGSKLISNQSEVDIFCIVSQATSFLKEPLLLFNIEPLGHFLVPGIAPRQILQVDCSASEAGALVGWLDITERNSLMIFPPHPKTK